MFSFIRFFCLASATTPRPPYCDTSNGYEHIHNGNTHLCVKGYEIHQTWSNSRAYCQSEHADLVVLDTHAKYSLLANYYMLKYGGNNRLWYVWILKIEWLSYNQRYISKLPAVITSLDSTLYHCHQQVFLPNTGG